MIGKILLPRPGYTNSIGRSKRFDAAPNPYLTSLFPTLATFTSIRRAAIHSLKNKVKRLTKMAVKTALHEWKSKALTTEENRD